MPSESYVHGELVLVDERDALRNKRVLGHGLQGLVELLSRVRVDHVRHGLERLQTLDGHLELEVDFGELSERGLVQVLVDAVVDVVDPLESGRARGGVVFVGDRVGF